MNPSTYNIDVENPTHPEIEACLTRAWNHYYRTFRPKNGISIGISSTIFTSYTNNGDSTLHIIPEEIVPASSVYSTRCERNLSLGPYEFTIEELEGQI